MRDVAEEYRRIRTHYLGTGPNVHAARANAIRQILAKMLINGDSVGPEG